jgi:hypothetical protein
VIQIRDFSVNTWIWINNYDRNEGLICKIQSPSVAHPSSHRQPTLHSSGRVAHPGDFRQALLLMVLYSTIISRPPPHLPLNSHENFQKRIHMAELVPVDGSITSGPP